MSFISDAIQLMKTNNHGEAAKLLEAHLKDQGLKASARIGMMSWISECYQKLGNRAQAAKWAEQAGQAALSCNELSSVEKTKRAREEFERALNYYEAINDVKGMGRMAAMKYGLHVS
jgi:tetratricopeptide (TPR) repeat protein